MSRGLFVTPGAANDVHSAGYKALNVLQVLQLLTLLLHLIDRNTMKTFNSALSSLLVLLLTTFVVPAYSLISSRSTLHRHLSHIRLHPKQPPVLRPLLHCSLSRVWTRVPGYSRPCCGTYSWSG